MIAFALRVLKVTPAEMWRLTPREIALAAVALNPAAPALERSMLQTLMAAYPDQTSLSSLVTR